MTLFCCPTLECTVPAGFAAVQAGIGCAEAQVNDGNAAVESAKAIPTIPSREKMVSLQMKADSFHNHTSAKD